MSVSVTKLKTFWEEPVVQKTLSEQFITETKVKKYALSVFSFLSAMLSCGVVSLTLSGITALPIALLSIPLLFFAYKAFSEGNSIKDYGDLLEIQVMQESARRMSFSELRKEHKGLENVLFYKIMNPSELRSKFMNQYEHSLLSNMLKECPLTYIKRYSLLTDKNLRELLYFEFSEMQEMTDLCDHFGEFGLSELCRFKVITLDECTRLKEIQKSIEKVEFERRTSLIKIHSSYLGRRECMLADLERKEAILHLSVLKNERLELQSILVEKERILGDETIGRSLQIEYEEHKKEILQEYLEEKKNIKNQFASFLQSSMSD